MVDERRKRLQEFIEPFRVEPGSKVVLRRTSTPRSRPGSRKKKDGEALLQEGVRAPRRLPGAPGGPGHLGRAGRPPGARRGRQGRDDPPRDERRQPAGRAPSTASRCPPPKSSITTTSGATPGGCPARARSGSSTAPTTRRCSSSGCTPSTSSASGFPEAAKGGDVWQRRYREINDWERYLSDNGIRDREAVPEPLEGGAAHALPAADRPAGPQLEVLRGRRRASGSSGTTTSRRSPRCSRTRAPSGRRGT